MENSQSSFAENVKKMINTFTTAELKKKEKDEGYIKWIKSITDPNFKLIQNLMTYFLDDLTSQEDRENIFKIIRKLLYLDEPTVLPQILNNKDFPKATVKYIITGDPEKISDNCFYLLTKLYRQENFKDMINEDFINALFNGLNIVHEEEILHSIVKVLILINYNFNENEENLFLKVHKTNPNARVLDEILLRILNEVDDENEEIKILKCINNLMNNEQNIFYESDLESFIDIVIPKLQMDINENNKVGLLRSLEKATEYSEYYKSLYKVEEITELMEDFEGRDDQSEEVRKISKQIVINLTNHQGKS